MRVNGGEVLKEKNLILFIPDGKTANYRLDINTGVLYGLRGTPIETLPNFVIKACNELENKTNDETIMIVKNFNIMRNKTGAYDYKFGLSLEDMQHNGILLMIDKIINAIGNIDLYYVSSRDIFYIDKNFTDFVKYMQNPDINANNEPNRKLRNFAKWHQEIGLMQKYHLENCSEFTQNVIIRVLQDGLLSNDEDIKNLAWYLENQLRYYYDNRTSDAYYQIRSYINYCEVLEKPIAKKGNFMSEFNSTIREYKLRKNEIDKKALAKNYGLHEKAWQFETDKYMIVIPETADDFINEGKQQNNCVGGYVDAVLNNRCYVIFIREKENPNKSFLTVEVGERYHAPYIQQFSLSRNTSIWGNAELQTLKEDFAEWLENNW